MQHPSATIRAAVLCAFACITATAIAEPTYEVEVKAELNGLPVKVEPQPFDGRLVMKLTNEGEAKVRCDLRYDASPQPIRRSYVYVEPGETAENSFQAKRNWFSVTVDVTCKPTEK